MYPHSNDILVIGVHGFNSDGEYLHSLSHYFGKHGFDYHPFIYGKAAITPLGNLIANRFRTSRVFNELAEYVIDSHYKRIILVGHSHGLRLSWGIQKAINYKIEGVIGINGALDREEPFENCWMVNCYHPDDWILKNLARFRPFSHWGDFGARVNKTADYNLNLSKYYTSWNPHSQLFVDNNKEKAAPELFNTPQLKPLIKQA